MIDVRVDEAHQEALKARLASPEGRAALAMLAQIIALAFAESLPSGADLALDTPEGMDALRAAWPDIVDVFLLGLAPTTGRKRLEG